MEHSGAKPSRGRSVHSVAVRAATGQQAAGRALPQLILDGLRPVEHVQVAMMICHPVQRKPTLFPPVKYATEHGLQDDELCIQQREKMTALVMELAPALENQRDYLIRKMQPGCRVCADSKQYDTIRRITTGVGIRVWCP